MKQMTVEEMEIAFELNRTPELLELMMIARDATPEQIEIVTTFLNHG